MIKKFISALLIIFVFSSISYGASSDDIYVRKDVFDAKMEALFNRLHGEIQALGNELKGEMKALGARMDALEKRMGSLETIVTWIFALLSVVVAAIALTPLIREFHKPKFTLEDVKKLIEENNAKLRPEYASAK